MRLGFHAASPKPELRDRISLNYEICRVPHTVLKVCSGLDGIMELGSCVVTDV